MNAKQWLAVTLIVILNIIILGALLGDPSARRIDPTPTWTPYPTFTPAPLPTATAILMPTLPPSPTPLPTSTPVVHVVVLGETLETIAAAYNITVEQLVVANHLAAPFKLAPGDQLLVPISER